MKTLEKNTPADVSSESQLFLLLFNALNFRMTQRRHSWCPVLPHPACPHVLVPSGRFSLWRVPPHNLQTSCASR